MKSNDIGSPLCSDSSGSESEASCLSFSPVVLVKKAQQEKGGDSRLLDIEKKYPYLSFVIAALDKNHMNEESMLVENGNGTRKKIFLTNIFGGVLHRLRKGESLTNLRGKRDYEMEMARHLVIITEKKRWWWWVALRGEKIELSKGVLDTLLPIPARWGLQ